MALACTIVVNVVTLTEIGTAGKAVRFEWKVIGSLLCRCPRDKQSSFR